MEPIRRRIAKQRRIVARIGAQLAFELLVLDRLERRERPVADGSRTLADILSDARRRRADALSSAAAEETGSGS